MGATFTKLKSFWKLKNCSVYLSNIESKVDEGFLRITHPDKALQRAKELNKEIETDREKF
jgi:hypothetical protein